MNTPEKNLRTYTVTMVQKDGTFSSYKIKAIDRRKAVKAVLNWFWYTFHGSYGQAHASLTVNDPYNEVRYGPDFICSDRLNKLLPLTVTLRLFKESKGLIVPNHRKGNRHQSANSVRRAKRRRDFGRFIAPCIKRLNSGKLYYRVTTCGQKTQSGVVLSKRKYRDIPLESRDLESALGEIQTRGLHLCNKECAVRSMKARRLPVAAHILGIITLPRDERKEVGNIIARYEVYRPCKTCVA